MLRINWTIPCQEAGLEDGLVMIRRGGFNRIALAELPSETGFVVAMAIAGLPEDFTEDAPRQCEAYLMGPNLTLLQDLQFELPSCEPDLVHPDGWEIVRPFFVGVRFEAQEVGAHSIDFYVNGALQAQRSVPFVIALIDSPGG